MNTKFLELRDNFSENLYKKFLDLETAGWNFYTNSTSENLELMNEAENAYYKLYQDKSMFDKFKEIDKNKLDKHQQKQLKFLLKNFENEFESGEDLKKLRAKENEISKKYNSCILKIDNKEVSRVEVRQILQKEKDQIIREKAYNADIQTGDVIAEDLKELVKLRNHLANKKGYNTFFEYKLKEDFEVDLEELENLLNDVYNKSKNKIKTILLKKQNELKKVFDIDELKPHHYGLLTEDNPAKKVNDYLESKEQVVEISLNTYKNMGYDVDKYIEEGKITLDLFPRKNKNTHGFCFTIDAGCDARILANLTNNTNSIDTINHEMGHCVYTLGISRNLPFLDRDAYPAMTEAIAMMMGDIDKREDILSIIVPSNILNEYKNKFSEDEITFVSSALVIINFEKEMYNNPDQDLKKLWHDLKVKYQYRSENETPDNGWATIPHFLSHPAYYQNYFRATIMKAQIYNYLKSQLGNITENKKTAEFLRENLFKLGTTLEENELIEKFTGKKLSVDDFVSII